MLALNGLHAAWLDPIIAPLTELGVFAFLVVLVARAMTTRTRRDLESMRDGSLAFFVAVFVVDTLIKPLVGRPRPTAIPALVSHLHVLGRVPPASSFSFPSGTAAACACAAAWIAIRFGRRAGIAAALLGLLLSLTRLYAGVHWPSDLVAGWVVGAAVALGVERLSIAISRAS